MPSRLTSLLPAAALALVWALGPALPAWARGELIGQPYTDLYPAVWGLWWFVSEQPGLPLHTALLGAPEGMAFYYSSPLRGWLATPLLGVLGLTTTWNLLLVLARAATVGCAFGAARAWGLTPAGALTAAAVYGAAPFFQGYAVEGIVEGTDGWALALWIWAVGRERVGWASLAFALTALSSWYMAATACLLALFLGRIGLLSALGGLVLSAPALWAFLGAFPARDPLDPEVRAAMGTTLRLAAPGSLAGLNPFAQTSWVGVVAPILALLAARRRPLAVAALTLCAGLSFGVGPWFELPPLSALRFPYRLHAGTLAALALLAGLGVERLGLGRWVAPLIVAEGLLLSPIEPVLPGAPAELPGLYATLPPGDVLLDLPGPLAMPPGEPNPSRPRARFVLYAQTVHGRASPWRPDFNSVGVAGSDGLDAARGLDPHSGLPAPTRLDLPQDVDLVMLRRRELREGGREAAALLEAEGWARLAEDEGLWLYGRAP
ncbi:hypothetical protein L6R49_15305 [Myxococcota bacterium]|nr:hypothetical protein [Myxococcota bacterium]